MKNRGKLWIYSLLFLLLVGTMILCISEFLHSEENQGFQRQHQEEQIAEWFLQDVRERAEGTSSEERAEKPWRGCSRDIWAKNRL